MSIKYRIYQNKIGNSTTKGKWYATAVHDNVVDLDNMADKIQRNCTAKRSDVNAVLTELVEVMNDALREGNRVVIDNFGSFKIGISSSPAESAEKFNAIKNIRGSRVNFTPWFTVDSNTRKRKYSFLQDLRFEEFGKKKGSKADADKAQGSADDKTGLDAHNTTGGDTNDGGKTDGGGTGSETGGNDVQP